MLVYVMPRQPEGKLSKRIQAYLRGRGAYVFKVHGSEFQEPGTPDLLCCYRGHFIGLELKMPGEKPSPKQVYIMGLIREAGGVAHVASSIDDVERILERMPEK